jgi:hypothetical protein
MVAGHIRKRHELEQYMAALIDIYSCMSQDMEAQVIMMYLVEVSYRAVYHNRHHYQDELKCGDNDDVNKRNLSLSRCCYED